MAKKKVRVDRIIILVLSVILVLGIIALSIYELVDLLSDSKNNVVPIEDVPVNVETVDDVNVSLVDYVVYKDDTDSLGFNFIVAKLKFSANQPVSFDLGNLQTSEKIFLNDTNKYIQLLQENGYKLEDLELSRYISSDEKSLEANIFIPYMTSGNIQVYNSENPATNLNFDLNSNVKYVTSLKFDSDSDIVIDNTTVRVSSSFVSTIMQHNGENYEIPSSVKVFTFKIYVDAVEGKVSIEDAYFIKDGEDEKIECLSSDYESAKVDNIIGKDLVVGENGALFFETYSRDTEPNYDGVLMLKFSNSDEWVKISTALE